MTFSFLVIFFFLADIFFLAFAIGFNFTGGRRRHGEEPAGPPTTPSKFETDSESQKKNISQEKKNITKNENIIQRKHQYPYNIGYWYKTTLL